jgi:hypothetical protein
MKVKILAMSRNRFNPGGRTKETTRRGMKAFGTKDLELAQ